MLFRVGRECLGAVSDSFQSSRGHHPELSGQHTRRSRAEFEWQSLTDEELLDMRLCDLPIGLEGTALQGHVGRLYGELEARDIMFKPHVWVGEEWFTPDGVTGFAIPFYLT